LVLAAVLVVIVALMTTPVPLSRQEAAAPADRETKASGSSPTARSGLDASAPVNLRPATQAEMPAESKEVLLAEIHAAAITYDPTNLHTLAPHLDSPDAEIRAAAADGIVLLGASAGSHVLKRAAMRAKNSREAVDWQSKAEYLELPPVSLFSPEKIRALREAQASQVVRPAPRPQGSPRGSAIPTFNNQ